MGLVAIFAVYFSMAYFVQTLSSGVIRPKIAADLNGMPLYAWAVAIPSLVMAFATLVFGKLSDMYGRRIMLLVSVVLSIAGTVLCAISPTFVFLIVASAIYALGVGAVMPLVFSVVGDLFPPEKRSKWIGLLHIPTGVCSLIGPYLAGWFKDYGNWRHLFWIALPLLIVCLIAVVLGIPSIARREKRKIDVLGCVLVAVASSTTITGLSNAGKMPWGSWQVAGLLAVAVLFWVFFFLAERRAEEPILDPLVLRNRSFATVSAVTLLSFFGQIAILMYFPMFLQGVQGSSGTLSAKIITPFGVIMSFMGVPVGFLLAKSRHFKWMYIIGFSVLTVDMFALAMFSKNTPFLWSVIAISVAGIGMGAIPTVNTMVVQNAVPKRLLGVAMGAFFFFLTMGIAISPAVLGAAMDAGYARTLRASLPAGLEKAVDAKTVASLNDPGALIDPAVMTELRTSFEKSGDEGMRLFPQAVEAVRSSLASGVRYVFVVGAITMLMAFLLISTIPAKFGDAAAGETKPLEQIEAK